MSNYINLFFSIYLHVTLLFIFLTIFFWTVISKTESDSINKEINNNIKDGLKNFHISNNIFTDKSLDYMKKYYQGQDDTVTRNNNQLLEFNIAFIVILIIGLIGCIFVRYVICSKNFDIWEVILENILILILVGAIEFYFFMNIASKYVPVLPSYLPNVVKNKIDKL